MSSTDAVLSGRPGPGVPDHPSSPADGPGPEAADPAGGPHHHPPHEPAEGPGEGPAPRPGRAARLLRSPRLPGGLMAALCLAYALGAALGWGSPGLALFMGDFGLAAAALAAALSCLVHGCTVSGHLRQAWLLFGLSSAMVAFGNGTWGWYEVVLGTTLPQDSLAEYAFLLFAPLAITGLLVLAQRPRTAAGWVYLVLDGWLVAGSLFTLSWSLALGRTAQGRAATRCAWRWGWPTPCWTSCW